ncbi:MAG: ATP-binding cassette domain-containing protein [Flavobacteriales bacterium]|nr:ATP-binding cassette domain-containing protein [Flavobacteriales bacterium]
MSAGILRALMQLFAIISGSGKNSGREIVAVFLRQQLNKEMVSKYLQVYEDFAEKFHKGSKSEKRTSMTSVKVLRICDQINEELQQKEKFFVVVRLLEFLREYSERGEQELELIQTVSDAFNIDQETFRQVRTLVETQDNEVITDQGFLIVSSDKSYNQSWLRSIHIDGLRGHLVFLRIELENLFFIRYFGPDELYLNSQNIIPGRTYVFGQGANIRGSKISPIFYSDIVHNFLEANNRQTIVYRAENVSYYFPAANKQALHQFNLVEESGNLVGIMGGSGAGKSTCLNILNGNYTPTYGKININGIDIHHEKDKIEGVLGYVAQDDLLIEELTVYQNLYYNARLSFADKTEDEIHHTVTKTLQSIGLFECKDLRVGSVLDKTISGGQRKRLNIALELIREPSVLFVDEPTSGLSSRDSENIMDLLKELTLRGKLIFVVIHQPSSDIFKMLDKLFILDNGGYPIYYGNPVESIIYFKRLANQVNLTESECPHCGNVNPEQIFNIIEAKVVDEYGNETEHRKVAPKEWNNFFNVIIGNHLQGKEKKLDRPQSSFSLPGALKQFKVFVVRDVLSQLANTQYMLINFLEAPVLAFVLSLFIKYYPTARGGEQVYTFRENLNFPQYLFISVVVAIFLGLTVSAEEIIKDQKILKRERYLNLNKYSYLTAKIGIMFAISLIQTFSFTLIGNYVLEIEGMFLPFWLALFSTSCFANVLGLNISASFNSAKVIYIIIPILIIPQLLFSGVIVRFDRLYPAIASQSRVPWVGNVMISRWAYEAMAVYQFKNNDFEKQFFEFDRDRKYYSWKKDYWVKELKTKSADCRKMMHEHNPGQQFGYNLNVLKNELTKELARIPDLSISKVEMLQPEQVTDDVLNNVDAALAELDQYYINNYNSVNQRKEGKIAELTATPELREKYLKLQDACYNESLEDFATNKNDLKKIVEYDQQLVQKHNPVFLTPTGGFFDAHFYAPSKNFFGKQITTLSANMLVIWFMTILMSVVLFYDGLKKLLDGIGRLANAITGIFKRQQTEPKN